MESDQIILADVSKGQPADLKFPLDFVREKIFLGGISGSGKSFTAGLLMEEVSRVGLQFVCFDIMGAHGGLQELPNVEGLEPKQGETVNLKGLVERIKNEPTSFIIDISDLSLDKQQSLVGEYCEEMLSAKLGKGVMTVFEECQDFVPQQGKPMSSQGVIRLCKLGRQYGYGVCLISQRPASVSKDALSQCSVYIIHNLINHRDLKAVEDQMGFGADREQVKKVLSDVASATQGEVICYSPSYFRNEGFYRPSKIRSDRQVNHTGKNIEMIPATFSNKSNNSISPMVSSFESTPYTFEAEPDVAEDFTPLGLNSEDINNDFAKYYDGEDDNYNVIDLDKFSATVDKIKSPKFKSPFVGLGMIAVVASGMFVVIRGLSD